MEEKMNVYQKLNIMQVELKAPKNQYNNFGKYNYRSAEGILEACKPLMKKLTVAIILDDEIISVGDRVFVQSTATFIDCESEKEISSKGNAELDASKKGMDQSQLTGSTSSYSRKYALNGLLCLDDNKDADALEPEVKQKAKSIDKKQIEEIDSLIEQKGVDLSKFLAAYKVKATSELNSEQYQSAKKALLSKPDAK